MGVSRRQFLLKTTVTAAATAAWPSLMAARQASPASPLFRHGVASGDPLTDRVVIWTRVSTPTAGATGRVAVRWRVASDDRLSRIVASGTTETGPESDFTVKVDVPGLSAGGTYYYAFDTGGDTSPTGRTKTLPEDGVTRVRLASVSCSNYSAGYFNVYRCVANRPDLDAVVHLGDYIYEVANGAYGNGEASGRVALPVGEAATLDEYRQRYATYRSDVDLQAAHAAHPFIVVWDDHEILNDASREGAPGHKGSPTEWRRRLGDAYRAYVEWMPVRASLADGIRLYRDFRFGALLDLAMLDTRGLRDAQVFTRDREILADPSRTLLGATQERWLFDALRRSQQSGSAWRVLGQQILFAPLTPAGTRPQNVDVWDGYPAARARVMDFLASERISNLAILTGDIHSSWAMDVPRRPFAGYRPQTGAGSMAVEIVTPAISSPPLFAGAGLRESSTLLRLATPHLKYLDGDNRGYVLLDVDAKRLVADWYHVTTVERRTTEERKATSFACERGSSRLQNA